MTVAILIGDKETYMYMKVLPLRRSIQDAELTDCILAMEKANLHASTRSVMYFMDNTQAMDLISNPEK
jgi:hypothetical protein